MICTAMSRDLLDRLLPPAVAAVGGGDRSRCMAEVFPGLGDDRQDQGDRGDGFEVADDQRTMPGNGCAHRARERFAVASWKSVNIAQCAMWPRRLNLAVVAADDRNLGEDAGAVPGWALHTQGPVYRGDAIRKAVQPGSVARSSADPVIRDRYEQPLLFEAQRDLD